MCRCWRFWQCGPLQRWLTGQRRFGDSCSSLHSYPADRLGASSAVSSPPVCDSDFRHESSQGKLQPRGWHVHKNPYVYSPSRSCLCLDQPFPFTHVKPVSLGQWSLSASSVMLAYTCKHVYAQTRVFCNSILIFHCPCLKLSLKQEKLITLRCSLLSPNWSGVKGLWPVFKRQFTAEGQVRKHRALQNMQHDRWCFRLLSQLLFCGLSRNQSETDLVWVGFTLFKHYFTRKPFLTREV